jgi:hypothetical protein
MFFLGNLQLTRHSFSLLERGRHVEECATFPHRRVSVYWCYIYIYAPASCSLSAMHSHRILSIIKCSVAKLYHCTQPFEPPLLSLTYSLHPRKEASLAFLRYTEKQVKRVKDTSAPGIVTNVVKNGSRAALDVRVTVTKRRQGWWDCFANSFFCYRKWFFTNWFTNWWGQISLKLPALMDKI